MDQKELIKLIQYNKHDQAVAELTVILNEHHAVSTEELRKYMHVAAEYNAASIIRLLHERYPTVIDSIDRKGNTALHVAAVRGNDAIVRLLGELGTCAQTWIGGNRECPIEAASRKGRASTMLALREIGCTHALQEKSDMMIQAIHREHVDVIRALHRINPNLIKQPSNNDLPPLHKFSTMNRSFVEIMKLLCQLDRSIVDLEYPSGVTPMHRLTRVGYPRVLRRVAVLHQYGSEAHFLTASDGQPTGSWELLPTQRERIFNLYFSRSLTEILYFALDSQEIKSSRRT